MPEVHPPQVDESESAEPETALAARREERRLAAARRRRRRRQQIVVLALAVALSPVVYSWVNMAVQPSSLPLGVRTVEWVRNNHGNWLVDTAEHYYYSWKAPKKGGPQLSTLPSLGLGTKRSPGAPQKHLSLHVKQSAQATQPHRQTAAYRPPRIKPLFAHALAGEGVWKPTGPPVRGGPPVLLTTFRPETDYPRNLAYVAWFDHTRTTAAWYPGRYEPPNAPARGPAMIPYGQRWRLLATFNGGFTYQDGHNGSAVNGNENEPLQDGLATLVGYRNGHIAIVRWSAGPNPGSDVAWARQSLPPIVWNRNLNPNLDNSTKWGFTLGNAVRVWRTGVGIDAHGNLIYAAANYMTVTSLAKVLQHAGAVRAMQFDINPEWPTLITYRHRHGLLPEKIVPNPMQSVRRYLVPDDRDFVAVYRRMPGPATVPFK